MKLTILNVRPTFAFESTSNVVVVDAFDVYFLVVFGIAVFKVFFKNILK
jgi:hypothetical protein